MRECNVLVVNLASAQRTAISTTPCKDHQVANKCVDQHAEYLFVVMRFVVECSQNGKEKAMSFKFGYIQPTYHRDLMWRLSEGLFRGDKSDFNVGQVRLGWMQISMRSH